MRRRVDEHGQLWLHGWAWMRVVSAVAAVAVAYALGSGDLAEARDRRSSPAIGSNVRIPLPERAPRRLAVPPAVPKSIGAVQRDAPTVAPRARPVAPAAEVLPATATAATVIPPTEAAPPAAAEATPPVLVPPADPLANKAHAVLEKHCARCHQAGQLAGGELPAAGFGNVLALAAIARNPSLIRPGAPDASPIYQLMAARQMPPDPRRSPLPAGAAKVAAAVEPDADELKAVREWIASLPSSGACPSRPHVGAADVADKVAAWIDELGEERAADLRFVSIAHLVNACADDATLAAVREGLVRLLNSLSWFEAPAQVEMVGDGFEVLAFHLSDLGWTREHWELLLARLPAGARIAVTPKAVAITGTAQPVVAADWLAATATEAELYARLLGLPPTLERLAEITGLALEEERENRSIRRGAVLKSAETGAARFIETYPARRHALWLAHDLQPPDPQSADADDNPLDLPLQPWSRLADEPGEVVDAAAILGTRVLFRLPNGFPAFASYDAAGKLVAALQQPVAASTMAAVGSLAVPAAPASSAQSSQAPASSALKSPAQASPALAGGLGGSCFSCHANGPRDFSDQLDAHLASDTYGGGEIERDVARQIMFAEGEIGRAVGEQRAQIAQAEQRAGLSATTTFEGMESLTGLARRYRRDVDLAVAAAEMLLRPEALRVRLAKAPDYARKSALRLLHGRIPRTDFEALRAALVAPAAPSARADAAASSGQVLPALALSSAPDAPSSAPDARPLRIELWPQDVPRSASEPVRMVVRASAACHVTLVNVDAAGRATVLYPNEFDRDNLLKPGEERVIPPGDASYRFRLAAAAEQFIAICEEGEPVPAGIIPDFTKQNFTALGDWQSFIASSLDAARSPRVQLDNGDDPDRRFRRGRRAAPPVRVAPAVTPVQARAAITVRVGGL